MGVWWRWPLLHTLSLSGWHPFLPFLISDGVLFSTYHFGGCAMVMAAISSEWCSCQTSAVDDHSSYGMSIRTLEEEIGVEHQSIHQSNQYSTSVCVCVCVHPVHLCFKRSLCFHLSNQNGTALWVVLSFWCGLDHWLWHKECCSWGFKGVAVLILKGSFHLPFSQLW